MLHRNVTATFLQRSVLYGLWWSATCLVFGGYYIENYGFEVVDCFLPAGNAQCRRQPKGKGLSRPWTLLHNRPPIPLSCWPSGRVSAATPSSSSSSRAAWSLIACCTCIWTRWLPWLGNSPRRAAAGPLANRRHRSLASFLGTCDSRMWISYIRCSGNKEGFFILKCRQSFYFQLWKGLYFEL